MRRRAPHIIRLSKPDRVEIERLLRDGRTEQRVARRGYVLLAMQDPEIRVTDLAEQVGMTRFGIWSLCRRYEAVGVNALYDAARSGRPREITALERVAIEQLACCQPMGLGLNLTHWSTRSLATVAVKRGLSRYSARQIPPVRARRSPPPTPILQCKLQPLRPKAADREHKRLEPGGGYLRLMRTPVRSRKVPARPLSRRSRSDHHAEAEGGAVTLWTAAAVGTDPITVRIQACSH